MLKNGEAINKVYNTGNRELYDDEQRPSSNRSFNKKKQKNKKNEQRKQSCWNHQGTVKRIGFVIYPLEKTKNPI